MIHHKSSSIGAYLDHLNKSSAHAIIHLCVPIDGISTDYRLVIYRWAILPASYCFVRFNIDASSVFDPNYNWSSTSILCCDEAKKQCVCASFIRAISNFGLVVATYKNKNHRREFISQLHGALSRANLSKTFKIAVTWRVSDVNGNIHTNSIGPTDREYQSWSPRVYIHLIEHNRQIVFVTLHLCFRLCFATTWAVCATIVARRAIIADSSVSGSLIMFRSLALTSTHHLPPVI